MPECPGCGATVAEEGETCRHCLDAVRALALSAAAALERERQDEDKERERQT